MSQSAADPADERLRRRSRRASTSSRTACPTCRSSTRSTVKPRLGLDGRDVILSFGLLGPGKGYELAIDALPAVVAAHPEGAATSSSARPIRTSSATEGEAYRETPRRARSQRLGHGRPRPVRRPVRRPRRADPLAPGRGRLRDALPRTSTRSSRARCRTRWAPAGRSSRRRTPTRPSCSPTAAASSSPPGSPSSARRRP